MVSIMVFPFRYHLMTFTHKKTDMLSDEQAKMGITCSHCRRHIATTVGNFTPIRSGSIILASTISSDF